MMMTSLCRAVTCPVRLLASVRALSLSSARQVKEIVCDDQDSIVNISARIVPSPHAGKVIKTHATGCTCSLCALNLKIKHTDVLILNQFMRSDGCMLPRRVTGMCRLQQRRLQQMVTMSQKAGLMPNLAPSNSKRDPKRRFGFKKFNKYFDETTIRDVRPFRDIVRDSIPPAEDS